MHPIHQTCALLLLPLLAATSCQNTTDSALRNEGSGEITTSAGEWSVEAPRIEVEASPISSSLPEMDEPIEVEKEISVAIDPLCPPPVAVADVSDERQAHANDVALAWLERSARTGSVQAQDALGQFLRRNSKTAGDPAQATIWFELAEQQRSASESCDTESQSSMGKGNRANWFTRMTGWSNPTAQHQIRSPNGN